MKTLTTNRYGQVSPTLIEETGFGMSSPFYISLTPDQKKSLLNTFRQIKAEQHANSNENKPFQELLGTPIEQALGMNEESLSISFLSSGLA